jgi:lipopolysaccharide assembly outer membrane protein LptD (OstA)
MKLSLAALAVCALALTAQDYPTGQLKHLPIPSAHGRGVSVAAMEIERGAEYPTIVHLKGSVEIKIPVCVVTGPGNRQVCNGDMVLRADEADFHEDTGQIEARGTVKVIREK